MPPRRRAQFTQDSIDQQLQQIHLLDPQSSSENLEQLGPIIKQIYQNRQQDLFLRTVQGLVASKDAEIEKICGDNYQDFIASLSTLSSIKTYTTNLRETITTLDSNVAQIGRGVVEKKRALLQSKKTAANLDEAIDTMQACLRVLDVVNRVGEMVREGKYWSALRSLEDIQNMPATSLSQTPLFQHLLSSLPSLRGQIKDAVTASLNQWLLEMREVSEQVGDQALDVIEARSKRWNSRREKDPLLKHSRVGSAVETIAYEKTEFNILEGEKLQVDFKPLYQCIHIYTALESLDELRKSYQADRKRQAELIDPSAVPLPLLIRQTIGFFIIETQVLQTTGDFRSERDVEELWDAVVVRLTTVLQSTLRDQTDPQDFMDAKEALLAFTTTLESYSYSTAPVQAFVLSLFEKYTTLLEAQFGRHVEGLIEQDDCQPMYVTTPEDRDAVLGVVWIRENVAEELSNGSLPLNLPWSQSFYECCQSIDSFTEKFFQFVDGISQGHRNVDELLGKSLDSLLTHGIGGSYERRLVSTNAPHQIGQMVMNLEYFQAACPELQRSLTDFRTSQRGGVVRITVEPTFAATLSRALARLTTVITSKLDDFFELSEYDWTPQTREDAPSMYLYELVNWLTTIVDSLLIKEAYKDEAYRGAVTYIAECLLEFLTGRNVPAINENAISNVLVDVDFLEDELRRINRGHLTSAFQEIRSMTSIPLSDNVQQYLMPAVRQASYDAVKPRRLRAMLEKLAKYGASCRDGPSREKGDRRRKEAEAVGRLYPGESR